MFPSEQFNYNQIQVKDVQYFSLTTDFLSMIVWGVKNNVIFKDSEGMILKRTESILSVLEENKLHIETDDMKYINKLHQSYLNILKYINKEDHP